MILTGLFLCTVNHDYTPPSYNFSWHNAPRRQYIVNLDADVEITVSSGETKVIRQGEVFFVEDTHGKLHVYIVDCDTVMLFQAKTGIFDFSLVST